jgi:hypothetical protein
MATATHRARSRGVLKDRRGRAAIPGIKSRKSPVAIASLLAATIGGGLIALSSLTGGSHQASAPGPVSAAHAGSGADKLAAPMRNCLGTPGSRNVNFVRLDACGYPSPNTTGVRPGTALRNVGAIRCVDVAINAVSTTGEVTIGSNCTITNSRIVGTIVVQAGPTNVILSHDELSGPYTGSPARPTCSYDGTTGRGGAASNIVWEGAASGITLEHVYLHCAAEPFNGNGVIRNSYIIADECWGPCGTRQTTHNEAVYIAGGGRGGSVLEHNTILNPWPQTAGVFGDDSAWGRIHDLTVRDNLVAAGGDNGAIVTGAAGDGNSNVRITGNRLSYIFDRSMPTGSNGPATWTGNYRDDTLRTVPASG